MDAKLTSKESFLEKYHSIFYSMNYVYVQSSAANYWVHIEYARPHQILS